MQIAQIEKDRPDRRRSRDEERDSADRRSRDEEGDRPDPRSEEGKQEIVLRHPSVRNEIFFLCFYEIEGKHRSILPDEIEGKHENVLCFYEGTYVILSFWVGMDFNSFSNVKE